MTSNQVNFYPELDTGSTIERFYELNDTDEILKTRCHVLYCMISNLGYKVHERVSDDATRKELIEYIVLTCSRYNKQVRQVRQDKLKAHLRDKLADIAKTYEPSDPVSASPDKSDDEVMQEFVTMLLYALSLVALE